MSTAEQHEAISELYYRDPIFEPRPTIAEVLPLLRGYLQRWHANIGWPTPLAQLYRSLFIGVTPEALSYAHSAFAARADVDGALLSGILYRLSLEYPLEVIERVPGLLE